MRHQLVLFGGDAGLGQALGDTWVWNGSSWRVQNPLISPPGRAYAQMTFDAAHGVVVLFGGSPSNPMDDTWTWDGAAWAQRCPPAEPPRLSSTGPMPAMAYDADAGVVVVFGGVSASSLTSNATWTWDGTTWTQWHAKP